MFTHRLLASLRSAMLSGLFAAILICTGGASFCAAAETLASPSGAIIVSPASLDLRHHRQPHALQVLGTTADGYSLDLRSQAKFTSADPKIATVDEHGWVRPVATGATTLTVAVAGQTKTVPVKVQLPAQEPPTSFRHEVMPVLARAGCNAGA